MRLTRRTSQPAVGGHACRIDFESVILGRNRDAPGSHIPHRVIPASMPKLQFSCLGTDRPRQELMTQTNAEVGNLAFRRTQQQRRGRHRGLQDRQDRARPLPRPVGAASISSSDVPNGTTVTRAPRLTSDRTMLRFTPQSRTTMCGPGPSMVSGDRRDDLADDVVLPRERRCSRARARDRHRGYPSAFRTITARVSPTSRICRVNARVSIPEIPGIPCRFKIVVDRSDRAGMAGAI